MASGLKSWSTTAGDNDDADSSINWAENQAPSTVNNSARAMMAATRAWYEDAEWRDLGHTVTRTGNTTFTIAADVTTTYVANRPIRCTDSSTLYGIVASSSYSAPNTTVTVTLDSGNLSASLTAVSLGPTPSTQSIPIQSVRNGAAPFLSANNTISGNNTLSGTNTHSGNNTLSGTNTFTGAVTQQNIVNYAATSGTDTYTASLSPAITAYVTGAHYFISFGNANATTTPTLNLNGLGAKTIVKNGSVALEVGDIPASHKGIVVYDGTNMVLTNTITPSASSGASEVLIASATASASNYFQFDAKFSTTFDDYIIRVINARPTTDSTEFKMQFGTGAGPTYDTGNNYSDGGNATNDTGTNEPFGVAGRGYIAVGAVQQTGNASTRSLVSEIHIYTPTSAALFKLVNFRTTSLTTGGTVRGIFGGGSYNSATAVTGARLFFGTAGTNTIAAGTAYLYGIRKA